MSRRIIQVKDKTTKKDIFLQEVAPINKDYPVRFRCLTPVWHPNVFSGIQGYVSGINLEDIKKQFSIIDRRNPSNIDACIQYARQDFNTYFDINDKLSENLEKNCNICGESLNDYLENPVMYYCFSENKCIYHVKCFMNLKDKSKCPGANCNLEFPPYQLNIILKELQTF